MLNKTVICTLYYLNDVSPYIAFENHRALHRGLNMMRTQNHFQMMLVSYIVHT